MLDEKVRIDDPTIVRVKIELEMVEGIHFPTTFAAISEQDIVENAIDSYIAWLDTWCNDKISLREYVQGKIIK